MERQGQPSLDKTYQGTVFPAVLMEALCFKGRGMYAEEEIGIKGGYNRTIFPAILRVLLGACSDAVVGSPRPV